MSGCLILRLLLSLTERIVHSSFQFIKSSMNNAMAELFVVCSCWKQSPEELSESLNKRIQRSRRFWIWISKGEQMLVLNKWNGRTYKVLEMTDNLVTLQRDDNSQFQIAKSEYFFNYSERVAPVLVKSIFNTPSHTPITYFFINPPNFSFALFKS